MKVSVIVCTKNRAHGITQCLDSIAGSLAAAAPMEAEIVVVDNASDDDTPAILKKWAGACAFPVQVLHEPKRGVSAARNRAIRAAKGDLLVFTDDDCRLSRNHVTDALRHDAADTGFVLRGGRVELGDAADLPITIQTYAVSRCWHRPADAGKYVYIGGGAILGCNMTMRRALAARIGFFDERIGPGMAIPAGEDTDYIYRAYLADVLVEYVPDMTVFHFHGRKTADEAKKLIGNYVQGTGALYAKYLFRHPNLRGKFFGNSGEKSTPAGKNAGAADPDLSRKVKLGYCALGALKYFAASMRGTAK